MSSAVPTDDPPAQTPGDDPPQIHPTAVVDPGAVIGAGTRIWHFCHVMAEARLGAECILGQNVFLGRGVVIGNGVKIQNNVSVYEGVELEDDVFCGPSAVFTNVDNPRAHVSRRRELRRTLVRRGATVGANATVLPGVTLGEYSFVGAGATVTRDVLAFALVVGTPAHQVGWMSRAGERLAIDGEGRARCPRTGEGYRLVEGELRVE